MKVSSVITLALLALAPAALAAGNAEAGKALYATCVACHGDQAQGNQALSAPRLDHLEPVYIVAQLEKFRAGQRGGEADTAAAKTMGPMAAVLPDAQAMLDVATYIAGIEGTVSAATIEGDATMGGDYYNQLCGACHGAGAVGNVALNSPRLAGSDDWYLLAQLQAFRSGARGAHPDDRTGRQMRAMATILPNEQALKDVVVYLRAQGE